MSDAPVVTTPVPGGSNPNDPSSALPAPAVAAPEPVVEAVPAPIPADVPPAPVVAVDPPAPPVTLTVDPAAGQLTAEPVKKPAPEKTNRDIIERAVWTAIQAGLGVITVEGLHLPVEYAVLVATALSAVKSYVKKQLDVPWV